MRRFAKIALTVIACVFAICAIAGLTGCATQASTHAAHAHAPMPTPTSEKPLATTSGTDSHGKDVTIILYGDACVLTDEVTDLPFRATWTERAGPNETTYEGCWVPSAIGAIVYWADHTVVEIPGSALQEVKGL